LSEADDVRRVLREDGIVAPEADRSALRVVEPDEIPRVILPGNGRSVAEFGRDLGKMLRDTGGYFVRDGEVVSVDLEAKALVPVSARSFRVNVERYVECMVQKFSQKGPYEQKETMGLEVAATVLETLSFKDELYFSYITLVIEI
jgi:hypothetical protein